MARSNTAQNVPISVDDLSPGFAADFNKYMSLSPAIGQMPQDPRLTADFNELFFSTATDQHGNRLSFSNRQIANRIRQFHERILAKIPQLEGNELFSRLGPATEAEMDAAPRTFSKTAQEVLAAPYEQMVIERTEIESRQISVRDSINKIIIDNEPGYITDTLLRNLGLDEYISPKRTNKKAKMARYREAIPAIKEMLNSLEPITRPDEGTESELNYFRLMRITQGPNKGYVIGTQNINGDKILFKTDLFGAKLRISHIEASHQDEIAKLKSIEMLVDNVIKHLDRWRELSNEEVNALTKELINCVDSLEHVLDEDKKDMREKIKLAMRFKDRQSRTNPTVAMMRLQVAKESLGLRLKSIEEIWQYLGKDRMKVAEIRSEEEAPLASFLHEVETLNSQMNRLSAANIDQGDVKTTLVHNLEARSREAEKLKYEPHLAMAEKFTAQIDKVIRALEDSDLNLAKREFVKIYLIVKIARTTHDLQRVYERITLDPESVNIDPLAETLKKQKDTLSKKVLEEDIKVPEYVELFDGIYHLYNSMLKRIRELKAVPGTPPVTTESPVVEEKPDKFSFGKFLSNIKEQIPKLSALMNSLETRVNHFIKGKKNYTEQVEPIEPTYTIEQKLATLKKVKGHIKSFKFGEHIRNNA